MKKRPLQSPPMSLRSTANPCQKGWSSERVPLPTRTTFLAFSHGRALPSKWEDAEKWIFNPVSSEGHGGSPFLSLHRPKSKSGPLRTPVRGAAASQSSVELQTPVSAEIPRRRNFLGRSPLLAGVLVPDQGHYQNLGNERNLNGEENGAVGNKGTSISSSTDYSAARTVGIHVWSDLSTASSSSSTEQFQDDEREIAHKPALMFSPDIQRREMGTQISPDCNITVSPKKRTQSPPSFIKTVRSRLSKLDTRYVQRDDILVQHEWSISHDDHFNDNANLDPADWKMDRFMGLRGSDWQASCASTNDPKLKTREAKITAWENLKKAEAEAQISKLEMKLERKRSSEIEKILRNLKHAQEKAQDMRNSLDGGKCDEKERDSKELSSNFWKRTKMACLCGSFSCESS